MRYLALTSLLLLGCTSSEPRYFPLTTEPGPMLHGARQTVVVRGPPVPRYPQRDEIVRRSGGGRVTLDDRDWWSETLRTMLQRVVADDLTQRLPDADVLGIGGHLAIQLPLAGRTIGDQVKVMALGEAADLAAPALVHERGG